MYTVYKSTDKRCCRDASAVDADWLYEASPPGFRRQFGRLHVEHSSVCWWHVGRCCSSCDAAGYAAEMPQQYLILRFLLRTLS